MSNNIQDTALKLANDHDYREEVDDAVKRYKEELDKEKSGYIIPLYFNCNNKFISSDEEGIVKKVASEVIQFRIKEKALVRLMAEGIIYPIGLSNGSEEKSVEYTYGNNFQTTEYTHLDFRRIIFNEFMKA